MNKFAILAPDDNNFSGECCTSCHTSRVQCHQRRSDDERHDGCSTAPETKVSSHQRGSGPSKLSAHRVSYLAASGGNSQGFHHASGSGWRRLSAIMDSGSAECVASESTVEPAAPTPMQSSSEGADLYPTVPRSAEVTEEAPATAVAELAGLVGSS